MAFWSDVEARKATEASQYLDVLTTSIAGRPLSDPDPSMYDNQAQLMQRLSWVYSAVGTVAQTMASLADWRVFDTSGKERKEIDNHDSEQLLLHPNPYQFDSRFEFFEALAGYLRLNGNAYIWPNAVNTDVPPAELWVLRPDRMQMIPHPTEYIDGYVYEVNGRKLAFERDEIIHFKTFHPRNDWHGLSGIEAIALASELDFKQQQYERNFYDKDNAKVPGALAFSDKFDKDEWQRMKSQLRSEHGGTKRRMMMLHGVGKGGVQWVQMGLSQQEMQYLQARQFTKEEIYTTLAPGLLQILDKNTTEANALAGEKTFREYCIWPMMQRIAEKLTAKMLPRYGDNLAGEFADIRHRDRAVIQKEQEAYANTHTVDEVRKEYYQDDGIGDERGKMLISEIRAGGTARIFQAAVAVDSSHLALKSSKRRGATH